MARPLIHPNWARPPFGITEGFSLEMTAKDTASLQQAAPLIPAETPVAVTFLPGEDAEARVATTMAVRALGFEPMPHFSARRIVSQRDFEAYLDAVTERAGVRRCFVIAGDPSAPLGPFADSSAPIATGAFERAGIAAIGIGGHPEGHPVMPCDQCWQVLGSKLDEIDRRGMAGLIVTQFGFDADAMLGWLEDLRSRGIDTPVRLGIPGPASIKALLRFAARCGVGASASALRKYGISLANVVGSAGPDRLVDAIASGLGDEHGKVRLHFYPFGGLVRTAEWISQYQRQHGPST